MNRVHGQGLVRLRPYHIGAHSLSAHLEILREVATVSFNNLQLSVLLTLLREDVPRSVDLGPTTPVRIVIRKVIATKVHQTTLARMNCCIVWWAFLLSPVAFRDFRKISWVTRFNPSSFRTLHLTE